MVATIPQLRQEHIHSFDGVKSEPGRINAPFGVFQGLPISSDERWSLLPIEGFGSGEER